MSRSNYSPGLYHFRDKVITLVENRDFCTSNLHLTILLAFLQNIAIKFGKEKLECCGYPTVK